MKFARCFLTALLIVSGVIATRAAGEPLASRFHFPAVRITELDIRAADPLAKSTTMLVEGHATEVPWIDHAPQAYAITDDFYFLTFQSNSSKDYVWNRSTQRLTPIGYCQVNCVPSLGSVTVRRSHHEAPATERFAEVIDFDPMTGEPRTLLRRTGERPYCRVLGQWDGQLAVATSGSSITLLVPGEAPRAIEVELGNFGWSKNCDSIRAGKLVVYDPPDAIYPPRVYYFGVGICDLSTGKTRAIGKAQGGWIPMGIDQPTMSVGWISRARVEAYGEVTPEAWRHLQLFGGVGLVHEETHEVWPGVADGE